MFWLFTQKEIRPFIKFERRQCYGLSLSDGFRYRIEIRQPRADGEGKQLITVGWHEAMRGCI